MSYHRDLAEEIEALDRVIEEHLKRLEIHASPEQAGTLNELKQILALKRALLFKLNDALAAQTAVEKSEESHDSPIQPKPDAQP